MATVPKRTTPDHRPSGVRLQKALAESGVGSRRTCEALIEAGAVRVNGKVVRELPVFVDPESDRIEVEGRLVRAAERRIYVMLYKPRGTVSTASDPGARRTVVDLVNHPAARRLYPVGRLDYDTTGLILLTNDGPFANRLTHPRYGVHKTYRALVKGRLEPEHVKKLEEGIYLAERAAGRTVGGARTARVRIRLIKRDRDRSTLELTLSEGRNRQVRRMLASVGHPVRKLERIAMGPVKLKGLRPGEWRELTRDEVRALKNATREAGFSKKGSAA